MVGLGSWGPQGGVKVLHDFWSSIAASPVPMCMSLVPVWPERGIRPSAPVRKGGCRYISRKTHLSSRSPASSPILYTEFCLLFPRLLGPRFIVAMFVLTLTIDCLTVATSLALSYREPVSRAETISYVRSHPTFMTLIWVSRNFYWVPN